MVWCLAMCAMAWDEPVVQELDDGAFQATTDVGVLSVASVQLPVGAAKDAGERVCRVAFHARDAGRVTPAIAMCPEALVEPTLAAMDNWSVSFAPSDPATDDSEAPAERLASLEVWVRYGLDAREPPELFVRGDWRHELAVPSGIRPITVSPAELGKPVFPPSEQEAGTLGAECTVDLELSHRGYLRSDPKVSGCSEAFAAAVAEAARRWRFKAPRLGQEPSAVAVTLGVVFEQLPGAAPGTFDATARVVLPVAEGKELVRRGPRPTKDGIPANAEPLLVLDHDPYAAVEVMGWTWPELALDAEARCDVLVQVDSRRRVVVWAEEACDASVRDGVVAAISGWSLRAGEIEPGERYGRFRATMVLAPGGEPYLLVPEADVVFLAKEEAARVHTFREPVTRSRVPPKMPKGLSGMEECVLRVEVGPSGKPSAIEAVACSEPVFAEAKKAVKQWRWDPARQDGKPLPWATTVKLTFAAPG